MSKKKDREQNRSAKLRPNDPCPCGSGRKYKKCHEGAGAEKPGKDVLEEIKYGTCNNLAEQAEVQREAGRMDEAFELATLVFVRGHRCAAWEAAGHLMVEILLKQSKVQEAERIAKILIEFHDNCPLGHFQLGSALVEQGEYLGAALSYSHSIRHAKNASGARPVTLAHAMLAKAAVAADRRDLIDPFLEQWEQRRPSDSESRYFWALSLYELGKIDDAEQILNELLRDTPRGPAQAPLLHELGMCALERGDAASAREHLLKAARLEPTGAHQCYTMLSIAEAHLEHPDEAIRWARRATLAAPENLGYRINLAGALSKGEQFDEAVRLYREILDMVPGHHAVRYSLAMALAHAGDLDGGLAELRVLERADYEEQPTSVNIGVLLARRRHPGDLEEALARHRRELEAGMGGFRGAILVLNTIGILANLGDWKAAAEFAAYRHRDWPAWAIAELEDRRVHIQNQERSTLMQDVVRLYGEEALAAMLTVPKRGYYQGSPPEHIAPQTPTRAATSTEARLAGPTSERPSETRRKDLAARAQVGIITALPKEFAAVRKMLIDPVEHIVPGKGAGRRYVLGQVAAADGGTHAIVLILVEQGNNIAATRATLLLEHFPSVTDIIMVGIAGGVPNLSKPDEHVRLGDLVISDHRGVVQYDFVKEEVAEVTPRYPPRPPSARLLNAVRHLQADEIEGKRPWLQYLNVADQLENASRPDSSGDQLTDSGNPTLAVAHPLDPQRRPGEPRVFSGAIASANRLLKNPLVRDQLRDKYGARAVEMEASGIADATWNSERGYLVVRGICDYCDSNKGDRWQGYAAVAAAAYTRALLESMPLGG